MANCLAKHTVYQPSDDEWKCPQCGGDNSVFTINESVENASEDCALVHEQDSVTCTKCGLDWSGKKITDLLMKKANLVPCPCCKGKGVVPKEGT